MRFTTDPRIVVRPLSVMSCYLLLTENFRLTMRSSMLRLLLLIVYLAKWK